jgi:hypothetical protein
MVDKEITIPIQMNLPRTTLLMLKVLVHVMIHEKKMYVILLGSKHGLNNN